MSARFLIFMSDMKFNFSQKMQQQLKLSAQMIQSVEMLRLPVEELCDRVYQEAEKNPAIEVVKDADLSLRSVPLTNNTRFTNASDSFQSFLENAADHDESLQEHLLFQLSLLDYSENERDLAERIIQNLDEHGFFTSEPSTLLYPTESIESLNKMLEVIRSFEPKGIAFSNVQESLLFQATLQNKGNPLLVEILKNHFNVLEKKRPPLIKKYLAEKGLECTLEELEETLECIRTLNPHPASQFASINEKVQYIVPDVIVRHKDEGDYDDVGANGFVVEFLKGSLPEIALSKVYIDLAEGTEESKETHQFAAEALQKARHFINALEYRTSAIYQAVQIIVAKQYIFFLKGPGHLVPLRQKDIAEEIGVHETTISRIANGKYVQCDWGIFEIKDFFSNAVNEQAGENTIDSKDSIKHQIAQLLQENEKTGGKKLSDAKLASLLESKGISIARRTVAKYRSELNIESSFDRL